MQHNCRICSQTGHNLHQFKCLGGTLFYDAASKKIFIYNHVSLNDHEAIASKLKMKQEALAEVIQIKAYLYDNGVYIST